MPSQSQKLIEYPDTVTVRRAAIPQLQCCDQLLTRRHADLARHLVPALPEHPTGSKLREAPGQREL